MDEPGPEQKADADERVGSPDFYVLTPPEELVRGDRTRDDFFDPILGLDSPSTPIRSISVDFDPSRRLVGRSKVQTYRRM